jgi:ATP-dependent exoDNAse (exonuclease V) beta subunit
VTGTVDRAFRDASGRMWIIDYKTSEHSGGSLDAFLDEEVRRYRTQLENYALLMSRVMQGPFHLGLYFPLLNAWREWEFVQEIAADYTGQ